MNRVFLFFFTCLSFTVSAQDVFISEKGEVSFFSEAPLENIYAVSTQVHSMIDLSNGEIAFIIPLRSFRFEKKLMQEHFNEKYMESDKYPQATLKAKIKGDFPYVSHGTKKITAEGLLNLHGKSKLIREQGQLTLNNNRLELTSEFRIALADYDINIPQLLFNNIADTVEVKLKATYVVFSKK